MSHNDVGRAIHCYFNGIPSDGNVRELSLPNAKIIKFDNIRKRV